jgi:hypothetical protein
MKKPDLQDVNRYAVSGMAAFLPGMQYMVELMQRQLDEFRQELALFQQLDDKRALAPEKSAVRVKVAKGAWAGMTAEERSAEMKRRFAVRAAKKAAKLHPRDPRHPGHDAWRETMRAAQKKRWNSMTQSQKKQQVRKMAKARGAQVSTARGAVEELRATA